MDHTKEMNRAFIEIHRPKQNITVAEIKMNKEDFCEFKDKYNSTKYFGVEITPSEIYGFKMISTIDCSEKEYK